MVPIINTSPVFYTRIKCEKKTTCCTNDRSNEIFTFTQVNIFPCRVWNWLLKWWATVNPGDNVRSKNCRSGSWPCSAALFSHWQNATSYTIIFTRSRPLPEVTLRFSLNCKIHHIFLQKLQERIYLWAWQQIFHAYRLENHTHKSMHVKIKTVEKLSRKVALQPQEGNICPMAVISVFLDFFVWV